MWCRAQDKDDAVVEPAERRSAGSRDRGGDQRWEEAIRRLRAKAAPLVTQIN